jgi:hypothetical protein
VVDIWFLGDWFRFIVPVSLVLSKWQMRFLDGKRGDNVVVRCKIVVLSNHIIEGECQRGRYE